MKHVGGKKTAMAFSAAVFAGALIVCSLAFAGGAEKTLKRSEDPVVVKPDTLTAMKDAQIQKLSLFAWDGKFEPIPFQVDERGKDGRFIYREGPEARPGDGDNKYNGDDELVFMAWDTGGKAPAGEALPCESERAARIALKDPLDNGEAWVYLAECRGEPPRSKKDYVRNEYDGTHDWVKSDRYHFAEKRGESYFDRLALRGENGKVGPNLVDRIKGRNKITAAAGFIKIETPESGLKGSIRSWIDGPVRVVRLMTAYIELSVIKINLGGQAENLFYPNYFVTPILVSLPFSPAAVLSGFEMRYAIDWLEEMEGAKYYDPINTKGMTLDGKMSDDERNMDYASHHDWYALTGPAGNIVVRQILPEKWQDIVPIKLYYVDDVTAEDPPEDDPGLRCPGFLLDSMVDIPAGKHMYYLYYMVPDKAPPASVPGLLNMLDHPLNITASEMP